MKAPDREAALTKIKEDPKIQVILISFKAGSTGLNLTACNNVILVDLWWNPALEEQAFDRAHRFGQTRDVNIFKLKIDNTVEDRILELQERKRALARAALSGAKLKDMHLGFEELLALLKWGKDEDSDQDSDD
jgi:SNF2 family DNA or RNA helicase